MKTFTLTVLLVFCFATVMSGIGNDKTWSLIHEEDGIEFYATLIMHKSEQGGKTLIKIKNTNVYEVRLQFHLGQTCNSNENKNYENTLVGASGMVMFTYNTCPNNQLAALQIEQFKLSK